MFVQFYNNKAESNGCVQVTPLELECEFNL